MWRDDLPAIEKKYNLPAGMLDAVAYTESRYNPNAVSPVGARGAFQFMPGTAKQFGIDPSDPDQSAEAAGKYLHQLMVKFDGDVPKALAGYNWGAGNVQRQGMGKMPQETKNYIAQITGRMGLSPASNQENSPTAEGGLPPPDQGGGPAAGNPFMDTVAALRQNKAKADPSSQAPDDQQNSVGGGGNPFVDTLSTLRANRAKKQDAPEASDQPEATTAKASKTDDTSLESDFAQYMGKKPGDSSSTASTSQDPAQQGQISEDDTKRRTILASADSPTAAIATMIRQGLIKPDKQGDDFVAGILGMDPAQAQADWRKRNGGKYEPGDYVNTMGQIATNLNNGDQIGNTTKSGETNSMIQGLYGIRQLAGKAAHAMGGQADNVWDSQAANVLDVSNFLSNNDKNRLDDQGKYTTTTGEKVAKYGPAAAASMLIPAGGIRTGVAAAGGLIDTAAGLAASGAAAGAGTAAADSHIEGQMGSDIAYGTAGGAVGGLAGGALVHGAVIGGRQLAKTAVGQAAIDYAGKALSHTGQIDNAVAGVGAAQRGVSAADMAAADAQRGLTTSQAAIPVAEQGVAKAEQGVQGAQQGVQGAQQGVQSAQSDFASAQAALAQRSQEVGNMLGSSDLTSGSVETMRAAKSALDSYKVLQGAGAVPESSAAQYASRALPDTMPAPQMSAHPVVQAQGAQEAVGDVSRSIANDIHAGGQQQQAAASQAMRDTPFNPIQDAPAKTQAMASAANEAQQTATTPGERVRASFNTEYANRHAASEQAYNAATKALAEVPAQPATATIKALNDLNDKMGNTIVDKTRTGLTKVSNELTNTVKKSPSEILKESEALNSQQDANSAFAAVKPEPITTDSIDPSKPVNAQQLLAWRQAIDQRISDANAKTGDLTGKVAITHLMDLRQAITDDLAQQIKGTPAQKALEFADKNYKTTIKDPYDPSVVKHMQSTNSDQLVQKLFSTKSADQVRKVMATLDDAGKQAARSGFMDHLMDSAKDADGLIDSKMLNKVITDNASQIFGVFSPETVLQMWGLQTLSTAIRKLGDAEIAAKVATQAAGGVEKAGEALGKSKSVLIAHETKVETAQANVERAKLGVQQAQAHVDAKTSTVEKSSAKQDAAQEKLEKAQQHLEEVKANAPNKSSDKIGQSMWKSLKGLAVLVGGGAVANSAGLVSGAAGQFGKVATVAIAGAILTKGVFNALALHAADNPTFAKLLISLSHTSSTDLSGITRIVGKMTASIAAHPRGEQTFDRMRETGQNVMDLKPSSQPSQPTSKADLNSQLQAILDAK